MKLPVIACNVGGGPDIVKNNDNGYFVLDLNLDLKHLPKLDGFTFAQNHPKQLTVTIKKGQNLNSVFSELSNKNVSVISMRNETGRLEELFLNLVENTA